MSIRPAMPNQIRSNQFIGATQKPIMAAPIPNMPPQAVTRFMVRRYGVVPIRTMAGFRTKMYGHDEGPDGKLRGGDARPEWIGPGDARPCVGRQGHRRRDVGDDAEVEDEEVRGEQRDPEQDECGRGTWSR